MIILRQIIFTTFANLKVRYRQSLAGVIWVQMNPLLIFGAQGVAFHLILKVEMENYLLFLASGLIPWIFISQSTEMSANIVVNSGPILRSYAIHPLVHVAAQVLDNFLNFLISFVILLGILSFYETIELLHIVKLLVPSISLLLGVLPLAFLVALIQVFFRDFKFILGFLFQLLFYLTPIFYPKELIPEKIAQILAYNPVLLWLQPFRDILLENPSTIASSSKSILLSLVVACLSAFYWRRKKNEVGFYV